MRAVSFIRRTTAAMLGVLIALSMIQTAAAAPPAAALAGVTALGPPSEDAAIDLQRAGRWDEAAEAWHSIADADPDHGAAWFNLGYCLHAGGHLQKAIEVHQKAATFDEFEGIALYNLGCAYALTGRHDAAFDALAASQAAGFDVAGNAGDDADLKTLHDDPRFAGLMHSPHGGGVGRGGGGGMSSGDPIERIMIGVQQMLDELLPQIERQIQMIVEQAMEQVHRAMQDIRRQLEQDERFSMLADQMGQLLGDSPHGGGGHDMAREIERPHEPPVIVLPSEDGPASRPRSSAGPELEMLLERARGLQSDGEWRAAAAAFEAAAEIDPESAQAWFGRAYCLHMNGQYEKAIVAHRKAASFDETRGISLYNLACASAILGKLDDAMMALNASRRAGFELADPIANDSDLDNLRDDPRFQKLLAELDVDY